MIAIVKRSLPVLALAGIARLAAAHAALKHSQGKENTDL
jgi:hypothetical protein